MFGPDRQSDAYPLTPSADVRAIRAEAARPYAGPEEAYDSHEEYMAALDRERWGDDPWLEGPDWR
jgi:hypothetical protein